MVGIIREIVRFQARREGKYSSPTPPACLGKLIPVGRKEDHPGVGCRQTGHAGPRDARQGPQFAMDPLSVRGAGDPLAKLFTEFLKPSPADAFVVVEAGELPSRSTLRRAFEAARHAVSVQALLELLVAAAHAVDVGAEMGVRVEDLRSRG